MRGRASLDGSCPVSDTYRLGRAVPALLAEDVLFFELCAALDELLGPIVAALDCFSAYLDPLLAPGDFLAWLGGLLGLDVTSEPGDDAAQRALVAGAVPAYRARGTVAGLQTCVAAAAGVCAAQVGIAEPGGVTWSDVPAGAPPAGNDATVTVTVTVPPGTGTAAVAARARAAACAAVPVTTQLRIEVVT